MRSTPTEMPLTPQKRIEQQLAQLMTRDSMRRHKWEKIKEIIEIAGSSFDINAIIAYEGNGSIRTNPLLVFAIDEDEPEFVEYLICEKRAAVNYPELHNSPLETALTRNNIRIIRCLYEHGAIVELEAELLYPEQGGYRADSLILQGVDYSKFHRISDLNKIIKFDPLTNFNKNLPNYLINCSAFAAVKHCYLFLANQFDLNNDKNILYYMAYKALKELRRAIFNGMETSFSNHLHEWLSKESKAQLGITHRFIVNALPELENFLLMLETSFTQYQMSPFGLERENNQVPLNQNVATNLPVPTQVSQVVTQANPYFPLVAPFSLPMTSYANDFVAPSSVPTSTAATAVLNTSNPLHHQGYASDTTALNPSGQIEPKTKNEISTDKAKEFKKNLESLSNKFFNDFLTTFGKVKNLSRDNLLKDAGLKNMRSYRQGLKRRYGVNYIQLRDNKTVFNIITAEIERRNAINPASLLTKPYTNNFFAPSSAPTSTAATTSLFDTNSSYIANTHTQAAVFPRPRFYASDSAALNPSSRIEPKREAISPAEEKAFKEKLEILSDTSFNKFLTTFDKAKVMGPDQMAKDAGIDPRSNRRRLKGQYGITYTQLRDNKTVFNIIKAEIERRNAINPEIQFHSKVMDEKTKLIKSSVEAFSSNESQDIFRQKLTILSDIDFQQLLQIYKCSVAWVRLYQIQNEIEKMSVALQEMFLSFPQDLYGALRTNKQLQNILEQEKLKRHNWAQCFSPTSSLTTSNFFPSFAVQGEIQTAEIPFSTASTGIDALALQVKTTSLTEPSPNEREKRFSSSATTGTESRTPSLTASISGSDANNLSSMPLAHLGLSNPDFGNEIGSNENPSNFVFEFPADDIDFFAQEKEEALNLASSFKPVQTQPQERQSDPGIFSLFSRNTDLSSSYGFSFEPQDIAPENSSTTQSTQTFKKGM